MTFADLARQIWMEQSFASIWYWALWVVTLHHGVSRVCGMPGDVIIEARSGGSWGPRAVAMAEGHVRRVVAVWEMAGWLYGVLAGFGLASLLTLGFVYGAPMGQALSLWLIPVLVTRWLGRRLARKGLGGAALLDAMERRMRRNGYILTGGFVVALCAALIHLEGRFLW